MTKKQRLHNQSVSNLDLAVPALIYAWKKKLSYNEYLELIGNDVQLKLNI